VCVCVCVRVCEREVMCHSKGEVECPGDKCRCGIGFVTLSGPYYEKERKSKVGNLNYFLSIKIDTHYLSQSNRKANHIRQVFLESTFSFVPVSDPILLSSFDICRDRTKSFQEKCR
jgi:hypothetical protein